MKIIFNYRKNSIFFLSSSCDRVFDIYLVISSDGFNDELKLGRI